MDGDNAACGAFYELRGAFRKRGKDVGGLGHGKFSGGCLHGRDLALARNAPLLAGWAGRSDRASGKFAGQLRRRARYLGRCREPVRCDAKNAAGIWSRTSPPRTAGAMIEGRTPDGSL
jgi:hypothetical protein